MSNRKPFFDAVRGSLFRGKLSSNQVSGMSFILDQWNETGFVDFRWLAYALATTKLETNHTMQPIKELGGRAYFMRMYDKTGSRPRVAKRLGNTQKGDGAKFCGRGFVQLTGRTNYNRASQALGVDCIRNPGLVMEPDNAAFIMFQGMKDGWFTGKGFDDYINASGTDYENARRIINGKDRAKQIARYAEKFEIAINAVVGDLEPPETIPAPIPPKPTPPEQPQGLLARIVNAIVRMIFK